MTREEFDTLKVGDIVTNKHIITNIAGEPLGEGGYDYKVIGKTKNVVDVKDLSMGFEYSIERNEIEECLDFRKK